MKFNYSAVTNIKFGNYQITKRMFGDITIWQNQTDFDYVFYEYKDFLALPERKVVDTGDLYPEGFDGTMYGSTFVVPGIEGISYPTAPGVSVITSEWFYINIGDSGGPAMPNGDYCNDVPRSDNAIAISDKDEYADEGWSFQANLTDRTGSSLGMQSSDTGFLTDHQFYYAEFFRDQILTFSFKGLDSLGKYEIRLSASRNVVDATAISSVTLGGNTQSYSASENINDGVVFTNLTPDAFGDITGTLYGDAGTNCGLSGIDFKRIG